MIATNLDDVTAALDFVDRVREIRPQAAQQADALRIAAADLRLEAERLASVPNTISAGDFAELRGHLTALLGASAVCLDNCGAAMAAVAAIKAPPVDRSKRRGC